MGYFQFLLKVLTKYKIIDKKSLQVSELDKISNFKQISKLSNNQVKTIIRIYTKTIIHKRSKRLRQLINNNAPELIVQTEKSLLKENKKFFKEELVRHDSYLKKRDKYL